MLDLAREQNAVEAWQPHLQAVRELFQEPTVQQYLASANVAEAAKFAIVDQALADVPAPVVHLAKLLVRKRRAALGDQVVDAFEAMVNAERGIAVATVTTAQPLDDEGRAAVVDAVRRATGASEVQLSEAVDRDLLGGAIIQMGDRIVDGSVRTRLAGLRRSIAGSIS